MEDPTNFDDVTTTDGPGSTRRTFLGGLGGVAAVSLATGGAGSAALLSPAVADAAEIGPQGAQQRRNTAYQIRHQAAVYQKNLPLPAHLTNGDEELYADHIASFSKALPHDALGVVDPGAYDALIQALSSGNPGDYEAIPLGGTVKLANPQAAYAFELEGADSHHLAIPAPPAFASRDQAGEMAEVYWQALTRDVSFDDYGTDPLIGAAVADLARFPRFAGVSRATIFRGETPGDVVGPYISQFMWKPIPYGATTITQRWRTTVPGDDYMTDYATWLSIQRGFPPASGNVLDPVPRYLRNGRDLSEWVHRDFTYQGFLNAALILLGFGGGALDAANPYLASATQGSFITFGGAHILDFVARVANAGLKAAWYQKWLVHRWLRPEVFAGRVHNHVTGAASYPLHPMILNSPALTEVFNRYGTYLLPMAYPEGSPTHPAYPAGHATISGACATVLKAFFKESFVIPSPIVPDASGTTLLPYTGPALTVGSELNKLAANISIGRDTSGVHYRADGIQGLLLGEQLAIRFLTDFRATYNESFGGFSLTKFDGTTISI
jgi:hypothetical protein